jgi:predicted O-methyltransferase YrrM
VDASSLRIQPPQHGSSHGKAPASGAYAPGMADIVDPLVEEYAVAHSEPEPEALTRLAEETRSGTRAPGMMTGHLEGRFLKALVALTGARRVLEIGTFTGYSALSMAEALPPDGRIVTCDISEEHVAIARRHVDASPYAAAIEIRLGPALETIATLDGPFDLVFIDADKPSYSAYLDAVLPLLAPDGVIAADNVLWSGDVVEGRGGADDENLTAIRAFNDKVAADERLVAVMVPIRDGVSLIRLR